MKFLLARLVDASSYASLSAMLLGFATQTQDPDLAKHLFIGSVVCGVIGWFLPGQPKAPEQGPPA